MSKQVLVAKAIKAMVQAALPGQDVLGLDAEAAAPARIPPNGRAVVRTGDPGDPEVDLCPTTYHFEHPFPVELAAFQSGAITPLEAVDEMIRAIAAGVAADRTLGGLLDYLELRAPAFEDIIADNSQVAAGTDLLITAHYSTTDQLN